MIPLYVILLLELALFTAAGEWTSSVSSQRKMMTSLNYTNLFSIPLPGRAGRSAEEIPLYRGIENILLFQNFVNV
jgi:hypothetical protein